MSLAITRFCRANRQNIRTTRQKEWRERGQAVVEAAFLIPLLLLALLLLIQPAILLYTTLIMQSAAAETCRIVATESLMEKNAEAVEGYALRRLAAVPQQENFHVHNPTCSWKITYTGDETASEVWVEISNEVKPLPLFDFGLKALGVLNENGNYQIKISHHLTTKSAWAQASPLGNNPNDWIERWNAS
jgi:hypothetical protein